MTGIGQLNAACSVNIIPAPLRASSADIARTLKNENCVKDVLLAAQAADVAIVGIGPSVNRTTRRSFAPVISARANS